jgi:hypothetical protein
MVSFWLMTGGMAFMTFVLTFAGTIQTHMQRIVGDYYMEVQDQLGLFYMMRFGAGIAVVLGALLFIYSQVVARREVIAPGLRTPAGRRGIMNAVSPDMAPDLRRPLLPPRRTGMRAVRGGPCQRSAPSSEGADRLRQDAVRRAYGRPPGPPALHRRLP